MHWKFQIAVPGSPVLTSECPWCSANPCGHRWGIGASSLQADPLSCTCTPKQVTLDHLTCNVNHGAASSLAGDPP